MTPDASKLLFLDIDGVLNDHRKHPRNKYCGILPECMARLNRVIETTRCGIVVTSAWRYLLYGGTMDIDGFRNLMFTHGLTDALGENVILSITRKDLNLSDKHERGKQIADWIRAEEYRGVYAVVDDDGDIGIPEAGHPFVRTNGAVGMTDTDADALIALLTR